MKKVILFLFLFQLSNIINSQPVFQKIYGQTIYQEGADDIQKTLDGGYMIGGYAYRPQTFGANDLYLLKINNAGVIQYGQLWGRTGYKDAISSIRQTSDSGFILLTRGQMSSGGNFNSSLVKTNSLGVIQWNKYFQNGTSSTATIIFSNICPTSIFTPWLITWTRTIHSTSAFAALAFATFSTLPCFTRLTWIRLWPIATPTALLFLS